ncbi:hypothetical protein WG66_003049 [Moniliophthora roreri]|nr:hypothetical protein WG66_003049 [Moniliophthora roreri]
MRFTLTVTVAFLLCGIQVAQAAPGTARDLVSRDEPPVCSRLLAACMSKCAAKERDRSVFWGLRGMKAFRAKSTGLYILVRGMQNSLFGSGTKSRPYSRAIKAPSSHLSRTITYFSTSNSRERTRRKVVFHLRQHSSKGLIPGIWSLILMWASLDARPLTRWTNLVDSDWVSEFLPIMRTITFPPNKAIKPCCKAKTIPIPKNGDNDSAFRA